MSFRQHVCVDFAALQTSYTVYTRCYISRFIGSGREVGHLLLHPHSTMSNPKENYLLLQHAFHNFTLLASPYPYIFMAFRSYLFIHGILYHLLSVFLSSPIICPLLFSFVYLFKVLSLCLKCLFFDKCIYFLFRTCPCVCIFWHY